MTIEAYGGVLLKNLCHGSLFYSSDYNPAPCPISPNVGRVSCANLLPSFLQSYEALCNEFGPWLMYDVGYTRYIGVFFEGWHILA